MASDDVVDTFTLLAARRKTPINPRKPAQRLSALGSFEQEDPESRRAVLARGQADDSRRALKHSLPGPQVLGGRHVVTIEPGNSVQFPKPGKLVTSSNVQGVDAPDDVLLTAQKMAVENHLELLDEQGDRKNELAIGIVRKQRRLDRPPTSLEMRNARVSATKRSEPARSRPPNSYEELNEADLTSDF